MWRCSCGVCVLLSMLPVSRAGLVLLVAAWHPSDAPCLAYFCLVTLQDSGAAISEHFYVEVTKFSPPFQVGGAPSASPAEADVFLLFG